MFSWQWVDRILVKVAHEKESHLMFYRFPAIDVLREAMQISRELKMQKEIEGIQDRRRVIRDLSANGLQWLNERPRPDREARNGPSERNTDDLEELLQLLLRREDEEN